MHLIAIWLVALLAAPLAAVWAAWDAGRAVPGELERVLAGAGVGAFGFGLGPVLGAQAFLVWVEDFVEEWTASAAGAVPELLVLGALVGSVMAALAPPAAEGLREGP